jgi:hypothetical protein
MQVAGTESVYDDTARPIELRPFGVERPAAEETPSAEVELAARAFRAAPLPRPLGEASVETWSWSV